MLQARLVRTLGIPADRIHVIGNAVDEELKPVTDSWALSKVRERYSIGDRYVLYFGGFELRKNVLRMIRSYAALPERLRKEYQLVIAGQYPSARTSAVSRPAAACTRAGTRRPGDLHWPIP